MSKGGAEASPLASCLGAECATPALSPLLSVEGLTVSYPSGRRSQTVIHDLSLSIERGTRLAVVGESGSGKSTLALAVSGFLNGPSVFCSARRLEFDGQPVSLERHHRLPSPPPRLSMVFQDAMTSLDPVWTIGSQIMAVIHRHSPQSRRDERKYAIEWLRRVGLTHSPDRVLASRPYELSGGMRQRAMLAIALCSRPALLIADEPTSALDASLSREVMELLVSLTEQLGTTLMMISHDIELCREYADRIIVMKGGQIVEDAVASTICETARHPYTVGLLQCMPTLRSIGLDRLPTMEALHD